MISNDLKPGLTLQKVATGIVGFDTITYGGLPKGRPTLVCGAAGSGKTLFALEFLIRGAIEFGEPGVFVAFEENVDDLVKNVSSMGFDLLDLQEKNLLRIDHVQIDRAEITETGEYDLEGLFIRLNHFVNQIGAKRVVLDTIETIFSGLTNTGILRNELQRLFRWLKARQLTTVITGEQGSGQLTRQGLEEYVSDCVVALDHRIVDQISTRRLRVAKYRGSIHGTNEYPFIIDQDGISVFPVTTLDLQHPVSDERISSGIEKLDGMLGGGLFRGTSVLVSGTAGTGKTGLGASFADATCRCGERCIYFALEESEPQVIRNMKSIGIDLQQWVDSGLLKIHATRPMHHGLETHLATMQRLISQLNPAAIVMDPFSNLDSIGTMADVNAFMVRLVDYLKSKLVTAMFVSLTGPGKILERTERDMSSVMDTWILLRDIESDGERNRGIYVLKSRGTNHSNQIREYMITAKGFLLREMYIGPEGVLTGTARTAQEARERMQEERALEEAERKRIIASRKRKAIEAQISSLRAELEGEEIDVATLARIENNRVGAVTSAREEMARARTKEDGMLTSGDNKSANE